MGLPDKFSEWKHLQDLIKKYHNQSVKQYFKRQNDNDISTPKSALKHACLIKDNDTSVMVQMRMWLLEVTVGHLQSVSTWIYGIPVEEKQSLSQFKPQVKLVFFKDRDAIEDEDGYKPYESEITFRLVRETSESMSRAKAEKLAKDIKRELTTPLLTWQKGWYKYLYKDPEKGYDFRLFVKSETAGRTLVEKILSIQNDAFEQDKSDFVDHKRIYPVNPGTDRIYGQTRKKPHKRPRVDVKFRKAQLLIHGMPNPINLVSVALRLKNAIEKV